MISMSETGRSLELLSTPQDLQEYLYLEVKTYLVKEHPYNGNSYFLLTMPSEQVLITLRLVDGLERRVLYRLMVLSFGRETFNSIKAIIIGLEIQMIAIENSLITFL